MCIWGKTVLFLRIINVLSMERFVLISVLIQERYPEFQKIIICSGFDFVASLLKFAETFSGSKHDSFASTMRIDRILIFDNFENCEVKKHIAQSLYEQSMENAFENIFGPARRLYGYFRKMTFGVSNKFVTLVALIWYLVGLRLKTRRVFFVRDFGFGFLATFSCHGI